MMVHLFVSEVQNYNNLLRMSVYQGMNLSPRLLLGPNEAYSLLMVTLFLSNYV